jgi:hypothetical protein
MQHVKKRKDGLRGGRRPKGMLSRVGIKARQDSIQENQICGKTELCFLPSG